MGSEQKTDGDKELAEIKREVIEARNLVIKTDNVLKTLHAEVKAFGKKQEELHRRQWMSSAVAYFVFALLSIGAAILVSSARTSSAKHDKEQLEKSVASLTAQLEKQRADAVVQQTSERAALDVYRQMTSLPGEERLKGVDALMKLDPTRLSPLERQALNDRAELLRREIGRGAYERGKTAFLKQDMNTAVAELSRFVAMNPDHQESLDASYYLGAAYNQLRRHDQAVPLLARFVAENKQFKHRDYAMLLLAQSYEQTGQLEKAADTVREALGTYPNSAFGPQLRGRLASVKRVIGQTEGKPGAKAPVAAPAPETEAKAAVPQPVPSGQ